VVKLILWSFDFICSTLKSFNYRQLFICSFSKDLLSKSLKFHRICEFKASFIPSPKNTAPTTLSSQIPYFLFSRIFDDTLDAKSIYTPSITIATKIMITPRYIN